jgi:hypothetical protein
MPTPLVSFDGLSNYDNIDAYGAVIIPPDMTGDVGPNHYVQAVNALVRIYNKVGTPLTPPFKMSQLFASLGTPCSARNDGEATVVYDQLADRWLLSQYCTLFPPFRQMIAISKTGDPTGEYYLYEFVMPNIRLNDLAKFGVWPDGYYMSTEEYLGADFAGTGMFAFDRQKMLVGDPAASYVYFNRPSATTSRLGDLLPSDLDGLRPPPPGSPNIFVGYSATEYGDAGDALRLFDLHADFEHPENSTFTERPESPLPVAAFDPTSPAGRTDISQPAPGEKLDSNSDRLNYRVAYRNFGTDESLLITQTVRLSQEPYTAGTRVYQLKRSGGAFSVDEQSTIGNETASRWIGSGAQDYQGNIAVSYSQVTDLEPPSVMYTGKLAGDPSGVFRDEGSLMRGTGVQKAFGWRWGDYSGMSVDPSDDCTFWMIGEYYSIESQKFSDFTWLTRIGAFKFPECIRAAHGSISGTVRSSTTGEALPGATVTASVYSRVSDNNGSYGTMAVLPGTYTITVTAPGYLPRNHEVTIADGQALVSNFDLTPVPVFVDPQILLSAESCAANGVPDPGETVTVEVTLRNTGASSAEALRVTLLPTGGITDPGPPQVYGLLTPGAAATRPFSFTVDSSLACGDPVRLGFRLEDGNENLGVINANLETGKRKVVLQQNFDREHLAQLPQRWTRSSTGGALDWKISTAHIQSGSKSAFSAAPIYMGVNEMVTPVFLIAGSNAQLTFRNFYDLETTFLRNRLYDGSVLEIRIVDGPWQDILAAGGSFMSGGYDGTIDTCCQNPLAGRLGWSGKSGINQNAEFITSSVLLPPSAGGHAVQLRWRVGTDIGGFREGQYIDDVMVTDGFVCGCPAGP